MTSSLLNALEVDVLVPDISHEYVIFLVLIFEAGLLARSVLHWIERTTNALVEYALDLVSGKLVLTLRNERAVTYD